MSAHDKHKHKEKESIAVRRERLLDEIQLERIRLRHAGLTLIGPLRQIDRVRSGAGLSLVSRRGWLYPLTPLLLFAALKFRPRLRTLLSLGGRGFAIWRLMRRLG